MKTLLEMARQVEAEGFAPVGIWPEVRRLCELVRADEREAIAQSLDKQADLAADEIDRQWAQEMAAAVRARGEKT